MNNMRNLVLHNINEIYIKFLSLFYYMNNIQYRIKEFESKNNDNLMENEIMAIVDNKLKNINIVDQDNEFGKILSSQMYYEEKYNKNHLIHIAHYYNISTIKKKKRGSYTRYCII